MLLAMRELIRITKALADPNRVRILMAPLKQELCVCQIIKLFLLCAVHRFQASLHFEPRWSGGAAQNRTLGFLPAAWVIFADSRSSVRRLIGFTNRLPAHPKLKPIGRN